MVRPVLPARPRHSAAPRADRAALGALQATAGPGAQVEHPVAVAVAEVDRRAETAASAAMAAEVK